MLRRLLIAGVALCASGAAQAQQKFVITPERGVIVERINDIMLRQWGHTNPQADEAAKYFKLSEDQTAKLRKHLDERSNETWKLQGAAQKLTSAGKAMEEAGVPFDAELFKRKEADLKADLIRYRMETRTMVRENILTDDQRRLFDAALADNNDPLTGQPADENLPNHHPAKYKAYTEAQAKLHREQWAAMSEANRAERVFNGKGFVETEWTQWLQRTAAATDMTDEQRVRAAEMLDLAKAAAAEYRKRKEADYRKIAAELAKAGDSPAAAGLRKAATELSAPVDSIGRKFREDVMELLSAEQMKKVGRR